MDGGTVWQNLFLDGCDRRYYSDTVCGTGYIGGIKRISTVAQVVVPFMALLYVVVVLIILFTHLSAIPGAIVEIVQSAFGLRAAAGGTLGSILIAMQMGIARGIFSKRQDLAVRRSQRQRQRQMSR